MLILSYICCTVVYPAALALNLASTIGAVNKSLVKRFPATITLIWTFDLPGAKRDARIRHNGFAPIANNKRLPFLDAKQRNKKKAEIAISPFEIGPRQPAGRTNTGITVKDFYSG
jgi:hypothetical protein